MEQPSVQRSICGRIADRLADSVGKTRFERYFQGCAHLRIESDRLSVATPSGFYASWMATNFGASLTEAARLETRNLDLEVVWLAEPALFALDSPAHHTHSGADPAQDASSTDDPLSPRTPRQDRAMSADFISAHHRRHPHTPLPNDPPSRWNRPTANKAHSGRSPYTPLGMLRHSLDDFVVGPCNSLAYDAALRLADPLSEPGFTSLFLHGLCGVGKTHILQGLASRFIQQRPGALVRYITGEAFTNEYITAVRAQKIDAFRAALRRLDLLCIDDMHFFSNKTGTQNEFLHTFDALGLSGSRVALASDEHPRRIAELSERLVSRCLSGMVVHVEMPDATTRARIIEKFALARGLRLSEPARTTIAAHCAGSVRDLAGAVARVEALARLAPELAPSGEVGVLVAQRAMTAGSGLGGSWVTRNTTLGVGGVGGVGGGGGGGAVSVGDILAAVCDALGVERAEALGRGRHQRVVLARSLAMRLARDLTTHSYPEIAKAMGRPNHSTVITACQRIQKQIEAGEECDTSRGRATLADLCARLRMTLQSKTRVA